MITSADKSSKLGTTSIYSELVKFFADNESSFSKQAQAKIRKKINGGSNEPAISDGDVRKKTQLVY
jgi:hypothetical protein